MPGRQDRAPRRPRRNPRPIADCSASRADYVVADGPGSNTETSRALLLRADLALVPCKASMLEVRALAQATNVLRQAQDIRGGQPRAVIVLSMVGKNYRLTQDMKDAAAALESAAGENRADTQANLRRRAGAGGRRLATRFTRQRGRPGSRQPVPRNPARCLPRERRRKAAMALPCEEETCQQRRTLTAG